MPMLVTPWAVVAVAVLLTVVSSVPVGPVVLLTLVGPAVVLTVVFSVVAGLSVVLMTVVSSTVVGPAVVLTVVFSVVAGLSVVPEISVFVPLTVNVLEDDAFSSATFLSQRNHHRPTGRG
jgi:hypothetical protein